MFSFPSNHHRNNFIIIISGPKSYCLVELLSTKVSCPKFLFGAFLFSKICLSFAISIIPCRVTLHLYFCTFHLSEFLLPEHHLHQCSRQISIPWKETPFPEMISSLPFWVYLYIRCKNTNTGKDLSSHIGWNLPLFNGMFLLAKLPPEFQVNLYLSIKIQFLFLGWLYSVFSKFSLLALRDLPPTFSWGIQLQVTASDSFSPPNLHIIFPVSNFFLGTRFLT